MIRKLFRIFCGLVLLVAVLAGVLVWNGRTERMGHADIGLVLGSKVNLDGTPSPRLKARLDHAIALYNFGYFKLIIASGGEGVEGFKEGTVMKDYLVSSGIPEGAVIVDNKGLNTYESAKNTAAILQARSLKSVFVVTQYFHIPRTKLALEKFGITPIYSSYPAYFDGRDAYSTLRELPAYVQYALRPAEATERSAVDP